jgi:4-amino-4-deoxy-L-arabinose transferase-like glycosyltransferase
VQLPILGGSLPPHNESDAYVASKVTPGPVLIPAISVSDDGDAGAQATGADGEGTGHRPLHRSQLHFLVPLAAIALVGIGLRLIYTFTIGEHLTEGLDTIFYTLVGGELARHQGYSDPGLLFNHGITKPTANFPPLYPIFLAGLHMVHVRTLRGYQVAGAICGGLSVALTGLLGRRVTNREAVGWIGAALVAVCPALIASDGSAMAETLSVPLLVGMLLAVAWASSSMSFVRWMVVGLLAGLDVLTRSEELLVALTLAPLAILVAPSMSLWRRLGSIAVVLIVAGGVVAPWIIRDIVGFDPPIALSTNGAKTLAGANCTATYRGPELGYWDFSCLETQQLDAHGEAEFARALDNKGADYVRQNASRVPLVAAVRVLRAWGLFKPTQEAHLEAVETRSIGWGELSTPVSLVLLILGSIGILGARRNRTALVILGGPVLIATLTVALTYGNQRFILGALPPLCVGSAIAVLATVDTILHRAPSTSLSC